MTPHCVALPVFLLQLALGACGFLVASPRWACLFTGCRLLLSSTAGGGGSGCNPVWTPSLNSHVLKGLLNAAGTNAATCQTACLNQANCTGCDWDTSQNKCYIITTSAAGQILPANSVNHYDLARNCGGEDDLGFGLFFLLQLEIIDCDFVSVCLFFVRIY